MFKPYKPKVPSVKHLRHELNEPLKEHVMETMGNPLHKGHAKKIFGVPKMKKRR